MTRGTTAKAGDKRTVNRSGAHIPYIDIVRQNAAANQAKKRGRKGGAIKPGKTQEMSEQLLTDTLRFLNDGGKIEIIENKHPDGLPLGNHVGKSLPKQQKRREFRCPIHDVVMIYANDITAERYCPADGCEQYTEGKRKHQRVHV